MDSDELKEQLGQSKKMLYLLGATVLFGVYMLWPSGAEVEEVGTSDLDAELAALQENRGSDSGIDIDYSTVDRRNVELGSSQSSGSRTSGSSYETGTPDISGILAGYGSQTDKRGEYLVAYILVAQDEPGYEIDLRDVLRYDLTPPTIWEVGEPAAVFGTQAGSYKIRARSIR